MKWKKTCFTARFKNPERRRYTWKSHGGRRYQLENIMVKERYWNSVKSACSFPGADVNSDHNLHGSDEGKIKTKTTKASEAKMKDQDGIWKY